MRALFSKAPEFPEREPDPTIVLNKKYCNSGVGQKSYLFCYKILNHRDVQEICVWKNCIITASRGSSSIDLSLPGQLCVWTNDGDLLHSEPRPHGVTAMVVWNDILVTGSAKKLEFWSMQKSKSIKCTFSCKTTILSAIIWDNILYTQTKETAVKTISMTAWSKNGKVIRSMFSSNQSFVIPSMTILKGLLWTASERHIIKIWKKNEDHGMEFVKELKGHSQDVVSLCAWNNIRVASTSLDKTIRIWNAEGENLYVVELEHNFRPVCITTWNEKLVVANASFERICLFYDEDRKIIQRVQPLKEHFQSSKYSDPIQRLFYCDGRLWQGTQGFLHVWSCPVEWSVKRLLLLALRKNSPAECNLAKLPRELMDIILTFLYY